MKSRKELLEQRQKAIMESVDFQRRLLESLPDYPPILKELAQKKIDEFLDEYNANKKLLDRW